jgi:hypothetical protein
MVVLVTDLFLVDAPVNFLPGVLDPQSKNFPTLRFPYSNSRGGIELPRLLSDSQNKYSIFEILKTFCQHAWHETILFDERESEGRDVLYFYEGVLPAHPMIYLISSCIFEENLRHLSKEIKRISFHEIRDPRLEINSILHDRREDLARLKEGLVEGARYVPEDVKSLFEDIPRRKGGKQHSRLEGRNLTRLSGEVDKLEAFLMDTFTLFMSSISVQDSRLGIEQSRLSIAQARRGSRLTILAFIYIPLSFVTGVFGMNIRQINSSGLNIWVPFVVLAGVILFTLPLFWAVKIYEDRQERKDGEMKKYVEV